MPCFLISSYGTKSFLPSSPLHHSGGGHGNLLQYSCLENPHRYRGLVGCSPWGCKESDTAEQLSTARCKCQPIEKGKACLSNTMKIVLNSQTSPTAGNLDHSFRITALGYRVGVYLSHLWSRGPQRRKKIKKVGECMLEGRYQAFFKSFQRFVLM